MYWLRVCVISGGTIPVVYADPIKLVLSHNRNGSDANRGNKLEYQFQGVAMKNASQYRAMASLCRQHAVYRPDQSWQLLGQAERWEHLAEDELNLNFKECNATSSDAKSVSDLAA